MIKCDLSYSNPCRNDAMYSVHWHMSFDPATPCHNYVCESCLTDGKKGMMIVLDSVASIRQEKV